MSLILHLNGLGIKCLRCKIPEYIKLFYPLITSGALVGKSSLKKIIHMLLSLSEVLMYKGKDPKKPRRLLLAFTGVSAININGVAIPSGLGINVKSKSYNFSDRQRVVLRNTLAEFRSIDETSMVSSIVFFKVNQ